MSNPMTLTEFLLARIAEDEETARDADGRQERVTAGHAQFFTVGEDERTLEVDPSRVLADCEAKRRIVERLAPIYHERQVAWDLAGDVLSDLALPYADHPDYREEWRP